MADSFDPATLAKFRKLQLMLAESPELVDALNNPELLALAALASSEKGKITKQQDQPLPPVWEPEPEPNYPTIGGGHSDDVSVMSEMTTPTVMTRQPVPEEEFYPEVRKSGRNSSSPAAAKNVNVPPIQQIGTNSYDDGVLPPPPSATTATGGGKTKNKVSQVHPNAARRAIARHKAQTAKAAVPSKPMMKIREDDVSSKSSSTSSASDLRASLLKRPPPLTARNGKSSKSASADDSEIERYPSSAVGSSSSHSNSNSSKSKSKNRSGTNGRGVKPSRSLPTKPVTCSSNHSSNSKRSGGGGSSYGSSDDADDDDDDDDIDISISVDLENDNKEEEEVAEKSYPSPASSRSSKNSKITTTTSSSRSDRVSDSSQPPTVTRRWTPPSKNKKVVPPAFRSMKSNSSHSQQQQKSKTISSEKVDIQASTRATSYTKDLTKRSNNDNNNKNSNTVVQSSSIRNSYHNKTPIQVAAANETKREVIGIESLKKTKKPAKVELVQKPKTAANQTKREVIGIESLKKTEKPAKVETVQKPNDNNNNNNNTITESLTEGGNNNDNNATNLNEVKTYFASTQQRQGTTSRPDDYLPGTDPFSNTRKAKERAKKKYGTPSSSGTSRVDEWLGSSGKKKERTWKVKEATT